MGAPALPQSEWDKADGEFIPASDDDGGGRWYYNKPVPAEGWPLAWRETRFTAQCTPFRHLGFFPDMAPVWDWLRARVRSEDRRVGKECVSPCRSRGSPSHNK